MTDAWGRRLFKVGAVWMLLLGVVHSLSLIKAQVPANQTERQLLDLMINYKFNLMGSLRSMNDLVRGFSVSFMVAALGFGLFDVVLWGERAELLKRAAIVNVAWLAVMTGVSFHYFFAAPTSMLAVGLVVFVAAWVKLPGDAG